jgi:Fic family protein
MDTYFFHDGNGRISRAMTNLLLLQSGYSYVPYVSLEEIIEDRKEPYYLSLRGAQHHHKTDNEDITTWILFLLDVLLIQAKSARNLIERNEPEQVLSERQMAVLGLFEEGKILSPKEIFEKLKKEVPMPTIKQSLARLVELSLIRRVGLGRATRYRKNS